VIVSGRTFVKCRATFFSGWVRIGPVAIGAAAGAASGAADRNSRRSSPSIIGRVRNGATAGTASNPPKSW
jgi:hypothetical protein